MIVYLIITIIFISIITFLLNLYMILVTKNVIIKDKSKIQTDAIVVLGSSIIDNRPGAILKDRLDEMIELYKLRQVVVLLSGDGIEADIMADYAIKNGVNENDILKDYKGLSTYDTISNAKKMGLNNVVISTQKYHLYRAMYIAKSLDINATGVSATKNEYVNQTKRDFREFFARIKDFFKAIIKPDPVYLGEVIPIKGNGDRTNDNE